MCGIAGIVFKDRERLADREALLKMRETMHHRGPDEEGIYLNQNVGLVHKRLSIIGVETGAQPMFNADRSLCIVYNGETYNYAEKRKELERKGYEFRTDSDTEVVLHLYAEYGADCVLHMNGLFAFAIWDASKQALFLARDRLGIKPLYYARTGESFIFGSEIKAILASDQLSSEINRNAVYEYFLFRAVAGEQTLFAGVKSLLPAHRMLVTGNELRIEKYWDHESKDIQSASDATEAADKLDAYLSDAVKIRLMSEVPLGTFCSGGVDSSLVTAMAAKAVGRPINTFSVGFHETGYDESEFARQVSNKYETIHHELKLSRREFAELLPSAIRLNDEPLNFANSVHILALSQLAKQYVTVVLTGEGADELFLGYPRYHLPGLVRRIRQFRWIANPLLSIASRITSNQRLSKIRRFENMTDSEAILMNAAACDPESLEGLLHGSLRSAIDYRRQIGTGARDNRDILSKLSVYDQHTYLVSILNRQDKMSMGASVEARVPFIDYRIAEFANGLDSKSKVTGFNTKQIVKTVAERYLSRDVVHRRKSGFGVPLADWFRDEAALGAMAARLFNETEYSDYLDRNRLLSLFSEHQGGKADHSEMLWTALNFLSWKEQYRLA